MTPNDERPDAPEMPGYPGTDRPAGPGAEDEAVVSEGAAAPAGETPPPEDAALPSDMKGQTRHPPR